MGLNLVPIDSMPAIQGVGIPNDFYWILQIPGPLAGMRLPDFNTPWKALAKVGFSYVVNLTTDKPPYNPSPLKMLKAVQLTDLYLGGNPAEPEAEEKAVMEIAQQVADKILKGEGAVIHCVGGRGRTGTVIGSLLVLLGLRADQVIEHLDKLHKTRGKINGWPESPWQAEVVRRAASKTLLSNNPV